VRDLGLSREARPLAERALAIDEAALGPDHLEVATDLNNLAAIVRDLGLSREARPLAERALAITEAALGPGHPYVAIRLTVLALIMQDLGQAGQARRWPSGRWPSPKRPWVRATPSLPSAWATWP